MNKRCTQCKQEKLLEEFSKDKRQRYGRRPECKACEYSRPSHLLGMAKQRVTKTKWYKGIEVRITCNDIADLAQECLLCQKPVMLNGCLHRINSKKHYEVGNIAKMHNSCHAKLHWMNRFIDSEEEG